MKMKIFTPERDKTEYLTFVIYYSTGELETHGGNKNTRRKSAESRLPAYMIKKK